MGYNYKAISQKNTFHTATWGNCANYILLPGPCGMGLIRVYPEGTSGYTTCFLVVTPIKTVLVRCTLIKLNVIYFTFKICQAEITVNRVVSTLFPHYRNSKGERVFRFVPPSTEIIDRGLATKTRGKRFALVI